MNLNRLSRRIARGGILVFAVTIGIAAFGAAENAPSPKQAIVAVKGMACPICAHRLQKVLSALPGATKAQVNLEKAEAVIDFTPETKVADEQIRTKIKDAGFVPGKIEWHTVATSARKPS